MIEMNSGIQATTRDGGIDQKRDRPTGLKLYSIQYLRAIAAVAVVLSHAATAVEGHGEHLIDLQYGACGVDVFFVVSGFIMFYTTFDAQRRAGIFLVKRLIRIVPLYFVLSTVMFVLVSVSPASFNKESPDFLAYLESVLFIPHWNPRLHDLQPILGQGWTLNYEMFFYMIFAASLVLPRTTGTVAAIGAIAALSALGYLHPINDPFFITYTSPLLLEFCLGIVVAACFIVPVRHHWAAPAVLIVILGGVSLYVYSFLGTLQGLQTTRPLFIGVPSALLVTAFVALERGGALPRVEILTLVGNASYSLYLVHGFVLAVLQRLWGRYVHVHSVFYDAMFIAAVLAVSVAVAIPVYRHIEVRSGQWLNSALNRQQKRLA